MKIKSPLANSLCVSIKCKDVYDDIINDEVLNKHFDCSEYKDSHPCSTFINNLKTENIDKYNSLMKNTGKFNCFKDEANKKPVTEAYCLKSKCYYLNYYNCEKGKIRNKGVNNYINNNEINIKNFENT